MSLPPVKCVSCGKVLGDKFAWYETHVREKKLAKGLDITKVVYLTETNFEKTIEGTVLDQLRLTSSCCRSAMLTAVTTH